MTSFGQLVNKVLIPTLKWHQNKDYLFLNFEVNNSKNEDIKLYEDKIFFYVRSINDYLMEFELNDLINVDESNYALEEKCVRVTLKKKEPKNWDFLTKDKNIYKNNIKINWAQWNDDSDDEINDQFNNSQFDFQKMMESMGGFGNMNNMMNNSDFEENEEGENDEDCCDDQNCCENKNCCDEEDCCNQEGCCNNHNCCNNEEEDQEEGQEENQ
jgi:hypothetical protein